MCENVLGCSEVRTKVGERGENLCGGLKARRSWSAGLYTHEQTRIRTSHEKMSFPDNSPSSSREERYLNFLCVIAIRIAESISSRARPDSKPKVSLKVWRNQIAGIFNGRRRSISRVGRQPACCRSRGSVEAPSTQQTWYPINTLSASLCASVSASNEASNHGQVRVGRKPHNSADLKESADQMTRCNNNPCERAGRSHDPAPPLV